MLVIIVELMFKLMNLEWFIAMIKCILFFLTFLKYDDFHDIIKHVVIFTIKIPRMDFGNLICYISSL